MTAAVAVTVTVRSEVRTAATALWWIGSTSEQMHVARHTSAGIAAEGGGEASTHAKEFYTSKFSAEDDSKGPAGGGVRTRQKRTTRQRRK